MSANTVNKVDITIMALREEIMLYFKGTCVQRFTQGNNIRVQPITGDTRYQYERIYQRNQNPVTLWLGNVPVMNMSLEPDTVEFNRTVLRRSKQLKEVMDKLDKFMQTYLQGVERKYNDNAIT